MTAWSRRVVVLLLIVVVSGLVLGVGIDEFMGTQVSDHARVVVLDADGSERASAEVRVAATWRERYVGLSNTESLGENEGMLFVHDRVGNYTYVMREMAFPIDIIFIDSDHRITSIHHAQTEEPPLTRYEGRGKWVLEVPYRWTERNNVSESDRIRIDWP